MKENKSTDNRSGNYRRLSDIIRRNGFTYQIVKRLDNVAMYSQLCSTPTGFKCIGYEVFIVKIRRANGIKGLPKFNYEAFPSNEDFGKTAYAPSTLQLAENRFNQLINRVNLRASNTHKSPIR